MSADRLVIRPGEVGDVDVVHAMIVAIASETGHDGDVHSSVDDLRRHGFGDAPRFHTLIAERPADGGGLDAVGLCLWFPSFSTWRGRPGGYVQDFYVAPDARGGEVAGRLLAAAAAAVRHDGGAYLRLSVVADNERGQRFYARTGMTWSSDERIFQIDGAAFDDLAGEATWAG